MMTTRMIALVLVWTVQPVSAQTGLSATASPTTPSGSTVNVSAARNTLTRWFRGYEFVPTAADYARLGAALGSALGAMVQDEGLDLVVRARAVSAMVYAEDASSLRLASALLADSARPSLLRRKAALVLGARVGGDAVASLVSAFTAARDDVFLREACARALRGVGALGDGARARLLVTESAPSVRDLLQARGRIGEPE